ncbi:hypothetical protein ACVMFA_009555 [Bradyrhizobium liaoningense]
MWTDKRCPCNAPLTSVASPSSKTEAGHLCSREAQTLKGCDQGVSLRRTGSTHLNWWVSASPRACHIKPLGLQMFELAPLIGVTAVPRTEVVAAIQAFTDYVRRPSHTPAEDTYGPQRTEEQLADWRSRVEAICSKMDAVADCPLSTLSEFEALRRERGTDFPATPPALLSRVADAFLRCGSSLQRKPHPQS